MPDLTYKASRFRFRPSEQTARLCKQALAGLAFRADIFAREAKVLRRLRPPVPP